jgi:uncharacterized protein (TIGR04255 family)
LAYRCVTHDLSPDFRYQPLVELRKGDGSRVVKIGSRVMSYHVVAPYPLWTVFQPEIGAALREVSQESSGKLTRARD